MTGQLKASAIGALVLVGLAAAGCKQPANPTASSTVPASATAASGVVPAPAAGTAAGGLAGNRSELKQARREVREACRDDLAACKAAGGDTRPMRCLRAKIDQLKPDCKQALQTMMAERREGRASRKNAG